MTLEVKTGMRLRSAVCDTEIIVVRATSKDLDLRCGGRPMLPAGATPTEKTPPEAGYDDPTLLGKRYADSDDAIEVLCAVAGPSTLSIGEKPLSVKGPRPLPASD
ncbi:MAG: Uncharacterized protein JWN03_4630 [Nocardia sp.]|uniref:hypothetical protein n=1 Tax=Nocardia sp. TaxID=1821 RepID=UPI002634ECEE|nr:hypothetical protein [Nocardia sp.]MCU1644355.1 Uncharacterized protein [Nocardia sp.]